MAGNSKKSRKPSHGQAHPSAASLNTTLQQAISLHQGGQPQLALKHYRSVLQAQPAHPDALHYMGVAQHQLGRHDDALQLIGRALDIAPDYLDARNNLGNVQKESGRYAEAELSYRAVLAARPDFVMAHNNLGVVLKEQGRHADAVVAYQQAVALAPDFAQGWLNLANALKKAGDLPEALTAYYQAVMLQTTNTEAYRKLGHTLVAYQRYDKALEVYQLWKKVEPDNPLVDHLIAACHGGATPERASDGFVQSTFDGFADTFDDVLAELDYRAPALCGELVTELLGAPAQTLHVLDAGCGTGLCGPLLKPYARQLHGVDLSAGMLAKARQRALYDRLDEAELTAWLAAQDGDYDLIVSADTLCYFGALDAALTAAALALRPGGHLVFTVEATSDAAAHPTFLLHPHGRYSHAERYVRATLVAAGLELRQLRQVTLRLESEVPQAGLLVGAVRPV